MTRTTFYQNNMVNGFAILPRSFDREPGRIRFSVFKNAGNEDLTNDIKFHILLQICLFEINTKYPNFIQWFIIFICPHIFNQSTDIHSTNHTTKYRVFVIKPRCCNCSNEELRSVGIWPWYNYERKLTFKWFDFWTRETKCTKKPFLLTSVSYLHLPSKLWTVGHAEGWRWYQFKKKMRTMRLS